MQISALTDIVEGKLVNSPSISFITQIHINLSKVNDGDAFVALNHSDIPKALEQGAFAILYENEVNISDEEVAWVQTPSIQKAITNILRYKMSHLESIQFFYIDKIVYNFINIFKTKEDNVILLKDNLKYDFELLLSTKIVENTIILSTNNIFLQKVYPAFKLMLVSKYTINNLISYSLFETSFSYRGYFFDRIKLPKVYINHFITAWKFFDYDVDLKKLSNFTLFKPIFINKSLDIVPFGYTNKFILANKDINISKIELRYINKEYKYGKIKVIDKQNLQNDDIISYIKRYNVNIIYFKNIDISKIEKILLEYNKEETLF